MVLKGNEKLQRDVGETPHVNEARDEAFRLLEPDVDKTPDSKSNDVSSTQEPQSRSPTSEAPSDPSDDESPLSVTVTACMAIGDDDVDPFVEATHKTTMSRKQFVEGLEAYNHHEWAVGVNYGIRDGNFTSPEQIVAL